MLVRFRHFWNSDLVRSTLVCGCVLAVAGFAEVFAASPDAAKDSPPAQPSAKPQPAPTARELTQAAFGAAVAGKDAERDRLLQQALALDSNYAPAHWLAGETARGGRWVALDDTSAFATEASHLAAYYQRRDAAPETVDAQLALAKWCAKNGYPEQARSHFTRALAQSPQNADAIAGLGLKPHNGQLMTQAQIDHERDRAAQTAEALTHWKPILSQIRGRLEHGTPTERAAAKAELAGISDPAAVGALEALISKGGATTGLEIVAAMQRIKGQSSTEALARQAVIAHHSRVREAAVIALHTRSKNNYVPALLTGLVEPIETDLNVDIRGGSLTVQETNSQSGKARDRHNNTEVRLDFKVPNPYYGFFIGDTLNQIEAVAENSQRQAQKANRTGEIQNARIISVLKGATGEDFGPEPRDWWDWWHEKNDILQNPSRPVDQVVSYYDYNVPYYVPSTQYQPESGVAARYSPQAPPPVSPTRHCNCFLKGTPIWTSIGSVPIETIRAGDLVLSQSIETGELAYKPVLETTLRAARPMVDLHFDGETITATHGHLFWIVGEGWQMAKELCAGQRLHATPRDTALTSNREHKQPEDAYNLVVADFGVYFVGQHRLLVHDNSERKAGDGKLPGMTP